MTKILSHASVLKVNHHKLMTVCINAAREEIVAVAIYKVHHMVNTRGKAIQND